MKSQLWLVVPAAGIGQRMKAECPKQYLKINNRFILDITLSRLLDNAPFKGCMVPLNPAGHWWPDSESAKDDRIQTCTGGKEPAASVLSASHAMAEAADDAAWVLLHDAARPCLRGHDPADLVETPSDHPVGGVLAAPMADTLKLAGGGVQPEVDEPVDRSRLWRALTPQMFRFGALRAALESCLENHQPVTDESSAMEFSGKIDRKSTRLNSSHVRIS